MVPFIILLPLLQSLQASVSGGGSWGMEGGGTGMEGGGTGMESLDFGIMAASTATSFLDLGVLSYAGYFAACQVG